MKSCAIDPRAVLFLSRRLRMFDRWVRVSGRAIGDEFEAMIEFTLKGFGGTTMFYKKARRIPTKPALNGSLKFGLWPLCRGGMSGDTRFPAPKTCNTLVISRLQDLHGRNRGRLSPVTGRKAVSLHTHAFICHCGDFALSGRAIGSGLISA
jgi:hypothetical protein